MITLADHHLLPYFDLSGRENRSNKGESDQGGYCSVLCPPLSERLSLLQLWVQSSSPTTRSPCDLVPLLVLALQLVMVPTRRVHL